MIGNFVLSLLITGVSVFLAALPTLGWQFYAVHRSVWTLVQIGWGLILFLLSSVLVIPAWGHLPHRLEDTVSELAIGGRGTSTLVWISGGKLTILFHLFGLLILAFATQDLWIIVRMLCFTLTPVAGRLVWWRWLRPDTRAEHKFLE